MPELPKLAAKEAEKLLLQNSIYRIYIKGAHRILPHHLGKILHPKIIKELLEIIKASNE